MYHIALRLAMTTFRCHFAFARAKSEVKKGPPTQSTSHARDHPPFLPANLSWNQILFLRPTSDASGKLAKPASAKSNFVGIERDGVRVAKGPEELA